MLGVGTRVVATLWVKIPATGWNSSDLDRMLLVACVLLVLAGPGAAAVDALWWNARTRTKERPRAAERQERLDTISQSVLQRADQVIE